MSRQRRDAQLTRRLKQEKLGIERRNCTAWKVGTGEKSSLRVRKRIWRCFRRGEIIASKSRSFWSRISQGQFQRSWGLTAWMATFATIFVTLHWFVAVFRFIAGNLFAFVSWLELPESLKILSSPGCLMPLIRLLLRTARYCARDWNMSLYSLLSMMSLHSR